MNVTYMFAKQLRILGSRLGTMADAVDAARHLSAGRFRPLVDRVFALEELGEAHRLMEEGRLIGKAATAKLGPSNVRFHEDGAVEVDGEEADNPDDYKSEPIPGGPTDPNAPGISGEEREERQEDEGSEGSEDSEDG